MRLLNTKTYCLTEFFDQHVPKYAILSHTWDHDEVTYQHIQSLKRARTMHGFAKVEGSCKLAATEGYEFIWIDACCIDKSSSAELSEAINSMYSWYQKSAVCYAYLADVNYCENPTEANVTPELDGAEDDPDSMLSSVSKPPITWNFSTAEFKDSRWFTRGWTLQELIAPHDVVFYSQNWTYLGPKSQLRELISEITGIDISILAGGDHKSVCVARKMFWASRRQTTRAEDIAYCLMGIFGVNMPLIYGEGRNAFIRLQEEIIKTHDDQSIFAWTIPQAEASSAQLYGLLADSPMAFKETGNLVSPFPRNHPHRQATRATNRGLETELMLQPQKFTLGSIDDSKLRNMPLDFYKKYHIAILDCQVGGSGDSWPCIDLVALGSIGLTNYQYFARVNPWVLDKKSLESSVMSVRVKNGLQDVELYPWPVPLLQNLTTQVEAFWKSSIPWDFQMISVSHKPRQLLPLGFCLQINDSRIRVIDGYPASQWFNHDKVLQRGYLRKGDLRGKSGPLSVKTKTTEDVSLHDDDDESSSSSYQGTEETASVVDGVVRMEIRPNDYIDPSQFMEGTLATNHYLSPLDWIFDGNQIHYVALVLGVDFTYLPYTRDWDRDPWCRLVKVEKETQLQDFSYEIEEQEEEESEYKMGHSSTLSAKVNQLDSNGLYKVQFIIS